MASAARRNSIADRLRNELELEEPPKTMGGIFAEEPVSLDVFLHDKKFMNKPNLILGEKQYAFIRHMEQIFYPEIYPQMVADLGEYWEPVRFVNLLSLEWGKGSGKDFVCQLSVARIAYLLLCLESPQSYYGLDDQSEIHILNVATNAPQAHRAFFKPLGNSVKKSRWFADHVTSEITDQAKSIRFSKQLELISGHSQAENLEGLNLIAGILDEISGFQSDEQKSRKGVVESQRTAEAVYKILRTSAATRFSRTFKLAAISYPRYLHDPIQNLIARGEADIDKRGLDKSKHYVDGPHATWVVNPRYKGSTFVTIPETNIPVPDEFVEHYEEDAAEARGMYECRPERAANRYMRNDSALAASFPRQPDHWIDPIQVFYTWGFDQEGHKAEGSHELAEVPGWQVKYQFSPELVPMEGAVYGIHVDLSVVEDRAGVAMCHVKNWERREHEVGDQGISDPNMQNDDRPIVKLDFVTYFEADLQARTEDGETQPREIQLRWARNLVRELRARGFPIGLVTFDTYQSRDSIQILEMWGIPADNLSVDRNIQPYANLRELIYDGRLEGYYNDILQIELEGLNLLPTGKVDHPPGGSKDLADAVCGAAVNAITLGGDEGEAPEAVDVNSGFGLILSPQYLEGNDPFWDGISLSMGSEDLGFVH